MAYFLNGPLGASPSLSYTTESAAPFALGTEAEGSDGITYRFVRTTAALLRGFVYVVDQAHTVGSLATIAGLNGSPAGLAIPQTAISAPSGVTYSYGWVGVKGPLVAVGNTDTIAASAELYICSVQGQLTSSAVASGAQVQGFRFTTAPTTASVVAQGFATKHLGADSA